MGAVLPCGKLGSEWSIGTSQQNRASSGSSSPSIVTSFSASTRNEAPPTEHGVSQYRKMWSGAKSPNP